MDPRGALCKHQAAELGEKNPAVSNDFIMNGPAVTVHRRSASATGVGTVSWYIVPRKHSHTSFASGSAFTVHRIVLLDRGTLSQISFRLNTEVPVYAGAVYALLPRRVNSPLHTRAY